MRFDDIEIDTERFELRRGGAVIAVEPKVLDLLLFMAENPNKLLSKDDLIEAVWQGRIVSDAALSTAIKSARRAIGDDDPSTSRIKTVRGRGFRLEAPDTAAAEPATPEAAQFFVQPSFAVLVPDAAMPWTIEVQRRVSAAMGRVPFVTVAAPSLIQTVDRQDLSGVTGALGRGFVLDLSVFGEGDATRMDCILIDTETGAAIWSYQSEGFDPVHQLARVVGDLVIRLEPQLVRAVYTALAGKTREADPRAMAMQALGTMSLKGWNRASFAQAEALLRQSMQLNADLPFAAAALALVTALGQEIGLAEPASERRDEAVSLANRAVDLDGYSPLILGLAGCALCDAGQPLRGKTLLRRALELDAGNPQAKAALGTQLLREGQLEDGVALLEDAIAGSARDTKLAVWRSILALAKLRQGQCDAALAEAERAIAADDNTHLSRVSLAVICLAAGRQEDAIEAWRDARRVTHDLNPEDLTGLIGRRGVTALKSLAMA